MVGWRVTVLVAAVVVSALGVGGVLPGAEGGWTALAIVAGGLLLGCSPAAPSGPSAPAGTAVGEVGVRRQPAVG
jgi:hypothetical protein